MLPRAVESLRAQHFRNWICEVHNDDPSDEFPEAYISSLKDERFIMKNHPKNLGGTGSFNLAFDTCKEDYISILEDDNWWDSDFLSIAIQYLETEKAVNVVWSNMKLWQEDNDGNWVDTKKTTWIDKEGETIFNWPQPTQAMAALHSNGAMVFREQNAPSYKVPECVMLNAIELIRERCFEHPIVLLNKPMANFAITKHTNRSSNPIPWILTQVMLLASYVSTSEDKYEVFRNTLRY
ncbi:MAG: glycosyltransferase, partial [Sphingobacteriales bacterium]